MKRKSEEGLTPFQLKRQRKARAHFMGRSNAALKLMNKRAKHNITLTQFRKLIEDSLGRLCRFCNEPLKEKTFSPDHKVPLSRGGEPKLSNIEIICLKCNHGKGALTDGEYHSVISLISLWDPKAQNDLLSRLRLGSAAKARWSIRWKRKQ